MQALKSIRPSNLVILFASPFLVYLFFVSSDYLRSLRAILGIEDNALQQFITYFVLLAILVLGLAAPVLRYLDKLETDPWRLRGWAAALLCLLVAVYAAFWLDMSAFVNSVVSNSVDPFTSTLIVPAKTPRQLTPEALIYCLDFLRSCIKIYIAVAAALTALAYFAGRRAGRPFPGIGRLPAARHHQRRRRAVYAAVRLCGLCRRPGGHAARRYFRLYRRRDPRPDLDRPAHAEAEALDLRRPGGAQRRFDRRFGIPVLAANRHLRAGGNARKADGHRQGHARRTGGCRQERHL